MINPVEAMEDLFPSFFPKPKSWEAHTAFLSVLFNLPISQDQRQLIEACTGRTTFPDQVRESWLIAGRRSGKSRITAFVAVYLACFHDYAEYLSPGEKGYVMVLAPDKRTAQVIFNYAAAIINETPMLSAMVVRQTSETIELSNDIVIEIAAANYRTIRGRTIVAALADETAFWRSDDSTNPDVEILNALRPAMLTVPTAMLLCIGSPYSKRGAMWEAFKAHYGQNDSNTLVWKAATWTMNPGIPEVSEFIREAYDRDPVAAAAEFGAEFRSDVSGFISQEAVDAVTAQGLGVLPYDQNYSYFGFVDPSGGSRDSFTCAISHYEGGLAILDNVMEITPPFSPEQAVQDICETLKQYHIHEVVGDAYGGEFPRELFNKAGASYRVSDLNRSQLYLELLPAINGGKVQLLDHRKLITQLASLERRTARSGKDSVDHPPGGHDDLANSVAGALLLAAKQGSATSPDFYSSQLEAAQAAPDRHANLTDGLDDFDAYFT